VTSSLAPPVWLVWRGVYGRGLAPTHAELDGNAELSSFARVCLPRNTATAFLAPKARLADRLQVL